MKWIGIVVALMVMFAVPVHAAQYYYYDQNDPYWIMEDDNPNFRVLVPANRDFYFDRNRFGEKRVEIPIKQDGPLLIVGSIKGYRGNNEKLRKSLVEAWTYLLTDVKVLDNREITTSKGLKATFYATQGRGEHGKDVMIRVVIFRRGNDVVYLSYTLDANQYADQVRQYWLEAVNSFEWR